MRTDTRVFWILLAAAGLLLSGCTGGKRARGASIAMGGYPQTGRQIIVRYRCGECHTIPGIGGANGVFGPPLIAMGRRTYIAGEFPNNPDNLTHWIMSPKSMKPKTAMPDFNLSEKQARDVAAYLYTLE